MGKILGIAIQNYGSLKDISLGKLLSNQSGAELSNMTAIIGPSGNGKSTLADAFGFLSDSLAEGVERACDARNRGGIRQLLSQGSEGPIHFEIYYKETQNDSPITYELSVAKDRMGRPYVAEERLRQRRAGEQIARCTAQNQNRHIVPPRVVARVERIERAVQHRHKRTGDADL